jgi:homoserine kinase type II
MEADAAAQLEEILSDHYEIGRLVDYEQLHLGYVNVSYIIETVISGKKNKYFLRRYKKGIREEEVRFEHSIVKHLVKKDFNLVAGLTNTRDGKTFVKQFEGGEDVFYAVFDFLPGEDKYTWVNPACSDEDLRGSASVLAQFHNAVSDLNPEGKRYEPKISDLLPKIAENVQRYAREAGKTVFDACFLKNLGLILATIELTNRAIGGRECKETVHQVIHCDYHPGNLKFQSGEITGLFDFDWSKVDARCFDVALAITYFCTTWEGKQGGSLQLNKAAAFLNAYQNTLRTVPGAEPLSDVELKCLPYMIHASNIYVLNWTIEDFYSSEADPREYLIFLQHGVRTMRWLEDEKNRDRLEKTIIESAGLQ